LYSDQIEEKEWNEIIKTIEDASDYYQRMNRLVTFFRVDSWRRKAAGYSADSDDVLEIGCGPGDFTKLLRGRKIVCVEPSEKLMAIAESRLGHKAEFRHGEAEDLPESPDSFDRVFCSFSFRDFMDKEKGLREIFRVLRSRGQLVILEVGKPRGKIRAAFMDWHLKHDVPFLAKFVVPRKVLMASGHNMYKDLWMSYQKYYPANVYADMMRKIGFVDVKWDELTFGGAVLIRGAKP
jgi:demethylmenaquinone methyltransferase/2-methoxy-6-polyprenyl-1,4-benzoquinol methylase